MHNTRNLMSHTEIDDEADVEHLKQIRECTDLKKFAVHKRLKARTLKIIKTQIKNLVQDMR